MRVTAVLCALLPFAANAAVGQVEVFSNQAAFIEAIPGEIYLESFETTETGSVPAPLHYSEAGLSYEINLVEPARSGLFPISAPGGDDVFIASNDARDTIIFDFENENIFAAGGFFFAADIPGDIDDEVRIALVDRLLVSGFLEAMG